MSRAHYRSTTCVPWYGSESLLPKMYITSLGGSVYAAREMLQMELLKLTLAYFPVIETFKLSSA